MLYSSGSIKFNALLEIPTDSATGWMVSELGITIQGHLGSKSPDLRQSRRLGYVNRSKRYLEKIL